MSQRCLPPIESMVEATTSGGIGKHVKFFFCMPQIVIFDLWAKAVPSESTDFFLSWHFLKFHFHPYFQLYVFHHWRILFCSSSWRPWTARSFWQLTHGKPLHIQEWTAKQTGNVCLSSKCQAFVVCLHILPDTMVASSLEAHRKNYVFGYCNCWRSLDAISSAAPELLPRTRFWVLRNRFITVSQTFTSSKSTKLPVQYTKPLAHPPNATLESFTNTQNECTCD